MSKQVETVFAEIYEREGVLDPETIHDEVAEPEHPLHGRYEWDDTIAGRQFRINQIRNDIRSITVRFVSSDDEEAKIRKYTASRYVHHPTVTSGYLMTDQIVADPLSSKILLRQLKRELAAIHRRYSNLEEYTTLVQQAAAGEVA